MNQENTNGLQEEGQKEINLPENVKPKLFPVKSGRNARTRRNLFVQRYLETKNITESARFAGFKEKSAYSAGNRLFRDKRVKDEIDKGLQRIIEGSRVRAEDLRIFWKNLIQDANANYSDRLRASELLAKELGLFKESEKPQVAIFQAFTNKDFKLLEDHKARSQAVGLLNTEEAPPVEPMQPITGQQDTIVA